MRRSVSDLNHRPKITARAQHDVHQESSYAVRDSANLSFGSVIVRTFVSPHRVVVSCGYKRITACRYKQILLCARRRWAWNSPVEAKAFFHGNPGRDHAGQKQPSASLSAGIGIESRRGSPGYDRAERLVIGSVRALCSTSTGRQCFTGRL